MRHALRILLAAAAAAFWIIGCVAGEQTVRPTPEPPAGEPAQNVNTPPPPAPSTIQAKNQKTTSTAITPITTEFDHKHPYDSVDWSTVHPEQRPPQVGPGDREWPGERLGLIGPIVAHSSKGSRTRYVLVYDAAGVLVGGMTQKEFKQDPEKFNALLEKAHQRSQHQNRMAMRYLLRKHHASQASQIPDN